ncbi:NfeD family protein [Thermodesulfovibrionales bacterium]|nr:NfeD family protein [Thermodesulfovibrionales bacterium]
MKEKKNPHFQTLILLIDEALIVVAVVFVLWLVGVPMTLWVFIVAAGVLGGLYWLQYKFLSPVLSSQATTGQEGMVGRHGVAITALNFEGTVRVRGEIWNAVSSNEKIAAGETVEVIDIKGPTLFVQRKK